MIMRKTWSLWILGLTALIIAAWYNLEAIGLKPDLEAADLIKLLSALLFISLIVERVLEVFSVPGAGKVKKNLSLRCSS
jgi:hypothetical protein